MPALQVAGLTRRFGGVTATRDVSLRLPAGARFALIGPNGAGKTTLVNLLAGTLRPDEGAVLLNGRDVTRAGPAARARLGLGRTFQVNQLFAALTPAEAVALAVAERGGAGGGPWRGLGRRGGIAAEAAALLETFGLGPVLDRPSASLSYGQQRQLELAMALAGRPSVLILDEPAAGVPQAERQDLLRTLARLPAEVAILLIEHDMDMVLSFADRILVMVEGAIFAEGSAAEVMADPGVRAAYLGRDDNDRGEA